MYTIHYQRKSFTVSFVYTELLKHKQCINLKRNIDFEERGTD